MSTRADEQREGQIDRVLQEQGPDFGTPREALMAPDPRPDRTRDFSRVTNLSRMQLSWSPADELTMSSVRAKVEKIIREEFADAFAMREFIWSRVRTPQVNESTGEILRGVHGEILWQRTVTGRPVEDWGALRSSEREQFIQWSSTALFGMKQQAADFWGEAMFAKGAWEEQFAREFNKPEARKTVEDRTALGRLGSMEERYLGIFRSWLSRRADAVVDSIELICQRMKDLEV